MTESRDGALAPAPELQGRVTHLRLLRESDLPALTALFADPSVLQWWGKYDEARIRAELLDDDESVVFAVEDRDGQFAGIIQYYEELDPMYRHASIDIALGTPFQDRGLGQDAARTLARYLIDERGHHRLTIDPAEANARAIRAYERVGFRRVGVLREYEKGPDGEWHNGLFMDLLARELREADDVAPPAETPFAAAIARIDAANAEDPTRIRYRGEEGPKERIHAELLTQWVKKLAPEASEALLLAARAQHIRRWLHPRSEYPEGRTGYLRWRTGLYRFHAEQAAAILREAGYGEAAIERVGQIIRKQGLGRDPEVQAIEDGLCLVFLETQLDELSDRLDRETMLNVLRKTWKKMSPAAHAFALELTFAPEERALIAEALNQE